MPTTKKMESESKTSRSRSTSPDATEDTDPTPYLCSPVQQKLNDARMALIPIVIRPTRYNALRRRVVNRLTGELWRDQPRGQSRSRTPLSPMWVRQPRWDIAQRGNSTSDAQAHQPTAVLRRKHAVKMWNEKRVGRTREEWREARRGMMRVNRRFGIVVEPRARPCRLVAPPDERDAEENGKEKS